MESFILTHRSFFARSVAALLALGAGLVVAGSGCNVSLNEGDRCNAALSHNECSDGLSCTQPAYCPETYCCPVNGTSSNPFCQAGCNGGAAAICTADMTQVDACVLAGMGPEAGGDDSGGSDGSGGDGATEGAADSGAGDTGSGG
jgi:hypothetical protein